MALELHYEEEFDGYLLSTRRELLKLDQVWDYLRLTYWGEKMSFEKLARAAEHCLPFGLYRGDEQIGFLRVVSDYTKFAYLSDFILRDDYQGLGLGRRMLEAAHAHPELANVDYWYLRTKDKQDFYSRLGWAELRKPESCMERRPPKQEDACIGDGKAG